METFLIVVGGGMIGFYGFKLAKESIIDYICLLVGVFLIMTGYIIHNKDTEKQSSIDALNGKNHYEMKINYTLKNDSTYVPTDTMYIEVKK